MIYKYDIYIFIIVYVYAADLLLPQFFTNCIRFVLSQTYSTLTKFIKKYNSIYNAKFI